LAFGVVIALLLLIIPGTLIGLSARLAPAVAVAVGPALTYGAVGLAIVPFGALGVGWNAWTALATLVVVAGLAAGFAAALTRYRAADAGPPASRGPALAVAAGVLLGAALTGYAAVRGMPHWQSIPSTWDAVWHANTVRFIEDTGQASPTHMGELRNVETHTPLYYPTAFHALTAVYCQLTGAAPTTGYTLASLATAVWLFPVSAAMLSWRLLRRASGPWRTAAAAATAAALAPSFTAVPYVEFGTAAMPNLAAFGIAVPAFVLLTSTPAHRDRIPMAVLALVGVFSVHLTGGVVTLLLTAAWWVGDALRHPVRGRAADASIMAAVLAGAALLLAPQLLGVARLSDIIAGHSFASHLGRASDLRDAVLQHTRHLNDFGIQYALLALAAVGAAILLAKKIWWPVALWAVLIVAIVHASQPFGGLAGAGVGRFSVLFYNDPRRLSAVVTLLLTPMAGIALAALVGLVVAVLKTGADRAVSYATRRGRRMNPHNREWAAGWDEWAVVWGATAAVLLAATTVGLARHYLWRHLVLFGDKYDSVMIDAKDLQAFAYLATLPGACDTVIGNANTDGSAWMYAVAGLHPLWTHYDFPQQQGPGDQRFSFWAHADDADTDPRAGQAVRALNIRYVLISSPTVRGFGLPEGLQSLDNSRSWAKIYDNGGARIYEWTP
jgi:hypothetical protein